MEALKKFTPPSFVSALLIVFAVAAIHSYQDRLPFDPIVWDFLVLVLMGYLRRLKLDSAELTEAYNTVDILRKRLLGRQTRGEASPNNVLVLEGDVPIVPERRSKFDRWFWG